MSEFTARRVIALGLVTAVGVAGCGSGSKPKSTTCFSPRSLSRVYEGDPFANPDDRTSWKHGVRAKTAATGRTTGLLIGFATPNADQPKLDWHDSDPVSSSEASVIALKLGPEAVRFSARIEATAGSEVCMQAPRTQFSGPTSFQHLVNQGGATPHWP